MFGEVVLSLSVMIRIYVFPLDLSQSSSFMLSFPSADAENGRTLKAAKTT